jgi:hypothetical protein
VRGTPVGSAYDDPVNRTHIRLAAVAAAATLLLVGCAAPSANKTWVVVEVATAEPVVVDKGAVPEPIVPLTWPLTGVETDEVADRPAMSVKIENSAAARPQTGLGEADVVWEEMVEGGITRFNAVFHSQVPGTLGPIRSLRPMDAAISAPFGGLFVFSGGQPRFVDQVAATGLTMLSHDGGDPGFYRTSDRVAPHNVYGDTEAFLGAAADDDGPPPTQFQFARVPGQVTALDGEEASQVTLAFPSATPGWSWNGEVWQRTEDGAAATTTDGGRIEATNVVVLRVEVRDTGAKDPGGNPVPETVLTGSGDATVFVAGHQIDATWSKPETDSVLELTIGDEPVLLAPGNVWVELVPVSGSSVSVS